MAMTLKKPPHPLHNLRSTKCQSRGLHCGLGEEGAASMSKVVPR